MNHRFRSLRNSGLGRTDSSGRSLLTRGVFTSNIGTTPSGDFRIALGREWAEMMAGLRTVGPVWGMVRNGHAVLAAQGEFSGLSFSSDRLAARTHLGESSVTYYFDQWKQAVAFDSGCCCGRVYGVEIENGREQIFHRICLARGTDIHALADWTQLNQATGLEINHKSDDAGLAFGDSFASGHFSPQTLRVDPERLRSVLLTAAQREIPFDVAVVAEGMTQTAPLIIERAFEKQQWLVFSGGKYSFYIESEPFGDLIAEPRTVDGESVWTLTMNAFDEPGLVRLQGARDHHGAWNSLIRELVLNTPEIW